MRTLSAVLKRSTVRRPQRKPLASPKPKDTPGGKWVLVPDEDLNETDKARLSDYEKAEQERLLEDEMDAVVTMLSIGRDPNHPFAAAEQFRDYFPGDQELPKKGGWIMMTRLLPTEFTPPPMSFWFATPWPMSNESRVHRPPYRVKIITPRGELGVFPHEYAYVKEPGKYLEFIGTDMKACFFGASDRGIPKDALFYLRSRGISKRDAITMLVGEIKAHGVLWLETAEHITAHFGLDWPDPSRLATVAVNATARPASSPVCANP